LKIEVLRKIIFYGKNLAEKNNQKLKKEIEKKFRVSFSN